MNEYKLIKVLRIIRTCSLLIPATLQPAHRDSVTTALCFTVLVVVVIIIIY